MPNRLAESNSPYLLQHADNPVDWLPWGEDAFERARTEDKPIFLSIGYATCHWCHVMAHESFEDEGVARMMNQAFVNVKVDREERPDVDGVYMAVAQALTGSGGWPLTIVMTPDGQPFFAGTYFPRESRPGRIGMLDLVPRIANTWAEDRDRVHRSAETITQAIRADLAETTPGAILGQDVIEQGVAALASRFDPEHGGFGAAPKFPTPHNLLFLLRYAHRTGSEQALGMVTTTLRAMRRGGLWDHVGFGFHRYSTDRRWLLPHFEKMLYDQALLAMAYTEAYQVTGDADFRATAEGIFSYVARDLTHPHGPFFSAEDADSLDASGHREEGAFYVWTEAELEAVLGETDAAFARSVFGTAPDGNFRDEATRQKTGANILHFPNTAPPDGDRPRAIRERLLGARSERPRPLLDDKVLTDWNGLMIAALAKASRAFGNPDYADQAMRAAEFLLIQLKTPDGRLLHRYRDGEVGITGHLDDYAFLVWGLLELYETAFDERFLQEALDLHRTMHERFADPESGGLFFTDPDGERLIARQKAYYDGAIPSGNSVAMLNGLRLGRLTGDAEMERQAEAIGASSAEITQQPVAYTFFLAAADFALGPVREVVVAGDREEADTQALLAVLGRRYLPRTVVALRHPGTGVAAITGLVPYAERQTAQDGKATAYVCENYACKAPVQSTEALQEALSQDS